MYTQGIAEGFAAAKVDFYEIEVMVAEEINNLQATGAVRIGGIVWSARSEHDTPIPAGTLVRVLRIEGVKVYVEKVKEEV